MKYEKNLTPLSKLAEWGVKGIYNEYGLERTFCSCGYVADKKVFVCPQCGNSEFVPTKDWQGHVIERPAEEVKFSKATDGTPQLVTTTTWLVAHRSAKNPADMELTEAHIENVLFTPRGYNCVRDTDMLRQAIRKYAAKLNPIYPSLIPIMDAVDFPIEKIATFDHAASCGARTSTTFTYQPFFDLADELMKSNELVLLRFLVDRHVNSSRYNCWGTVEEELEAAEVPKFLWRERNSLNVLSAFSDTRNYYYKTFDIADVTAKWNKLPMDIQNAILLYLKQGLITSQQMQQMVFFDEDLLNECPLAMAKVIKKYFVNFRTNGWSDYGGYDKRTITEMYEFYKSEGLPITADTFDFRAWRSCVNSKIIHKAGYDEKTVHGLLENFDKSPLDTIINLGQLRRPRKKKTP